MDRSVSGAELTHQLRALGLVEDGSIDVGQGYQLGPGASGADLVAQYEAKWGQRPTRFRILLGMVLLRDPSLSSWRAKQYGGTRLVGGRAR